MKAQAGCGKEGEKYIEHKMLSPGHLWQYSATGAWPVRCEIDHISNVKCEKTHYDQRGHQAPFS